MTKAKGRGGGGLGVWGRTLSRVTPPAPLCALDTVQCPEALMASLDTTEICLDLLTELNKINESDAQHLYRALNKVFPVCLKCHRCLTSSCPHHSKTAATHAVSMLTIFIHSLNILLLVEEIKLKVELGFELSVFGKVVHKWKKTLELPDPAGNEECFEERCEVCGEPLPRDTQEGSSLPNGHLKRPGRKEQCGTRFTVARPVAAHGVGQGKSLHTPDPMWPLPPWAQPPVPNALDQLQRAGMEPLPGWGCQTHLPTEAGSGTLGGAQHPAAAVGRGARAGAALREPWESSPNDP